MAPRHFDHRPMDRSQYEEAKELLNRNSLPPEREAALGGAKTMEPATLPPITPGSDDEAKVLEGFADLLGTIQDGQQDAGVTGADAGAGSQTTMSIFADGRQSPAAAETHAELGVPNNEIQAPEQLPASDVPAAQSGMMLGAAAAAAGGAWEAVSGLFGGNQEADKASAPAAAEPSGAAGQSTTSADGGTVTSTTVDAPATTDTSTAVSTTGDTSTTADTSAATTTTTTMEPPVTPSVSADLDGGFM